MGALVRRVKAGEPLEIWHNGVPVAVIKADRNCGIACTRTAETAEVRWQGWKPVAPTPPKEDGHG